MRRTVIALLLTALAAGGFAACGSEDEDGSTGASATEEAFLKGMIPHHESAVEMAEIARERGQHREVKGLAHSIVESQASEIAQMEQIYERLAGEEIAPDPAAHEELGLSQDEAGMHEGGAAMLDAARKDFDKAFIDEMVPHHQGAIRQAYILLEESQDQEMIDLARSIVDAQSREIRQMNSWRKRWYGRPSAAGGVPSDEELPPAEEEGGEHDSGH
jgi:uncharacterized protein (DUF305 family)